MGMGDYGPSYMCAFGFLICQSDPHSVHTYLGAPKL
jgi:hypothetical protein